jgi:hypothetical protein
MSYTLGQKLMTSFSNGKNNTMIKRAVGYIKHLHHSIRMKEEENKMIDEICKMQKCLNDGWN